jgi:hypothetical protein
MRVTGVSVVERFNVATSTLYQRLMDTHAAPGVRSHRNLSMAQENVLLE